MLNNVDVVVSTWPKEEKQNEEKTRRFSSIDHLSPTDKRSGGSRGGAAGAAAPPSRKVPCPQMLLTIR